MKHHRKSIMLSSLSLILLSILIPATFVAKKVAALTYQSGVGVSFTFNPTITINVGGDLTIDSLTPGSSADSNIISVGVATNASYGYNLSATVGQKGKTSALVNEADATKTFTNLATTAGAAATLTNFSDDTWGYAYSADDGATWVSGSVGATASGYAGLPLDNNDDANTRGYGGVTLISTDDPADSQTVKFKIGAKASSAQASGTYTNIINFYAVSNPIPMTLENAYAAAGKTKYNGYYKLQDMNSDICNATEILDDGSQMQAIDTRDNKIYWITKLQDGHCWMTQNLDLDIDENTTYTAADTDLGRNWTNTNVDNTATWTPERSTIKAITDESTTLANISAYVNSSTDPYSVDPGNWYWDGTYYTSSADCPSVSTTDPTYIGCNYMTKQTTDNNSTTIVNKWADHFATTPYSLNGQHGHLGNYYNFSASIASNDSSAYTTDTASDTTQNPTTSICPANWRLPKSATYTSGTTGNNEFYNLSYYYNGGATNTDKGIIASPLYFVRAGVVWTKTFHVAGYGGYYWSSTVVSDTQSYDLDMNSGWFGPFITTNRYDGRSVRCLAR